MERIERLKKMKELLGYDNFCGDYDEFDCDDCPLTEDRENCLRTQMLLKLNEAIDKTAEKYCKVCGSEIGRK